MRRREVETAPEKRQLWEKEQNKQDKKIFFKHINPVKLHYIILNPPSALMPISH